VVLKSTSHAVYESKYHLVWCPKYRKKSLVGAIRDRVKELFYKIAEEFDFEIDSCEVAEGHIHLLLSFPPRYSISRVIAVIKSISSSKIFQEFPTIRNKLWGGHLWEQGYFVRTVGEQMTDDVIKRYIEKHSFSYDQPTLWDS
jgi:putative transposase